MISRRNIRVKVMQLIYSLETLEETGRKPDVVLQLQKRLDASRQLFTFLLYNLTEVARFAERDAHKRAAKNLPSEADRNVDVKIAGNHLIWKILEDPHYIKALEKDKPELISNSETIRRMYNEMLARPEYQQYIVSAEREKKSEKEIVQFIFFSILLPSDVFTSQAEEHFTNWDDDVEMMEQLMQNYLQRPSAYDLSDMVGADKWKFAKDLLQTTLEKKEYLLSLITPKLKNWDADRIAQLDMILMNMGVAELLYFETIPPKVTINEYIDIAKEYSTDQSGQFVNGILDSIHKELLAAGKIQKVDFRHKTN
ncbi:MAG: nusB [Chitinophagaceae bacterium]|nr:nusB [Chitinophagaceae bacterium]